MSEPGPGRDGKTVLLLSNFCYCSFKFYPVTRTQRVETSLENKIKFLCQNHANRYSLKTRSKNCKIVILKMYSDGTTPIVESLETVPVAVAVENSVSDIFKIN